MRKDFPEHEFFPLLFLDGYVLSAIEDEEWKDRFVARLVDPSEAKMAQEFIDRIEFQSNVCEREMLDLLNQQDIPVDAYVRELFRIYNELAAAWFFPITLAWNIEHRVLALGLAHDEGELLRWAACYHNRSTWLEQQLQEIEDLACFIREKSSDLLGDDLNWEWLSTEQDVRSRIEDHVKRFEWFGTHHWIGDSYTAEKCLADIRDVLKRGIREKMIPRDEVSGDEYEMIGKLLALFAYWRTHCAEVAAKVIFHSRGKLTECAKRWNLSYDEFIQLSSWEILRALDKPASAFVLPKNFYERRDKYGCLVDKGEEKIVTGAKLADLVISIIGRPAEGISEIYGVVASKGVATQGKVRVIISPADFDRFEQGDILVAPETTPDFVPLMKKAAAIITDIGGITSHAAIVSRELRKPCIIGTKIATQVLHDGDVVEVDADHGVVRILEKG